VTGGVGQAVSRPAAPLVAQVVTASINVVAVDDRELSAGPGLYHSGVVRVARRLPPGRDSCRQVNYIFASVRLQH